MAREDYTKAEFQKRKRNRQSRKAGVHSCSLCGGSHSTVEHIQADGSGSQPPKQGNTGQLTVDPETEKLSGKAGPGGAAAPWANGSVSYYQPGDQNPFIRNSFKGLEQTAYGAGKTDKFNPNNAHLFGFYDHNRNTMMEDGRITYSTDSKDQHKSIRAFSRQSGIDFTRVTDKNQNKFGHAEMQFNEWTQKDLDAPGSLPNGRAQPWNLKLGKDGSEKWKSMDKTGDKQWSKAAQKGALWNISTREKSNYIYDSGNRNKSYNNTLHHEIGHALGLTHPTNRDQDNLDNSMMAYTSREASGKFKGPSKTDKKMIGTMYGGKWA